MFKTLSRSWEITKLSFRLIGKDKEMLLFPLLSGIFSLLFIIAILFPTVFAQSINQGGVELGGLGPVDFILLFTTYMGLAFCSTFFNVCTVYTTKTRLEGGDATFGDSIKFASSRLRLILGWSFVSATVGMILYMIDQLAQRLGGIGEIVVSILRGLIGAAWSIVTLFVVPVMVYKNLGPVDAVKSSISTLKKTWGESLVRHYGLGMIQFLFILLGIGVAIALFISLGQLGSGGIIAALILTVIYFLAVILIFSTANSVFNTVLYHFAENGHVDSSIVDERTLREAFGSR